MGFDAESKTVLGYYINNEQSMNVETTRGCMCELTEDELKQETCPLCGKFIEIVQTINLRDKLEEDLDNENEEFKVFNYSCDLEDFYVGMEIEDVMYLKDLVLLDFKVLAKKLAAKLKPYGLVVNTDDFGLHNFLYEDY